MLAEPTPTPFSQRSWPRRLLNRLEVDRAVFYVLLTRGWQFLAGPISMLVFAQFFSPAEQGYFGMFATLMGLHILIELGLHGVVAAVASHEWSRLTLAADGRPTGDPAALSRLADLHLWTVRWYAGLSLVFTIAVSIGGYWFLLSGEAGDVAWGPPWFCLVLLNGPLIALWSLTALLEGCNQVRTVNMVRFWQGVTGHLVVWPTIMLGAGLWSAVAAAAVRLAWDVWLVSVRYGRFFRSLREASAAARLDWKSEVWPMQWRTAVRSLVAYFALQLFVPVMYYYHGPEEQGRLWLTWTALTALEGAAFAWVQTRGPLLGMLVARRDWGELDRVFLRVSTISCSVLTAGGVLVCLAVAALPHIPLAIAPKLSSRLLPVLPTAVFVAAMLVANVTRCLGLYVFVHKRDPFVGPGLFASAVTAACVWWGGKEYGALGEAVGYLLAMSGTFLPLWSWQWLRCRREWHAAA